MAEGAGGLIAAVEPGSLAERIRLAAGDRLISINGNRLRDVIDVQFYGAEETLALVVEQDGQRRSIEADREYGEELGIEFASPTFDVEIRRCANNCDFCFVKQNPPGLRRSLAIRDDDYRYSFLFGNFVTLTNLAEDDWLRLEEQRLSPLYVSVHATELELRRRFLRREGAPDVLDQLRRLASLGIDAHAQVVLVPGLNDGEHLARTIADLTALYHKPVLSIGIVPVGLTRYHRGPCRTYTPQESRVVLERLEAWRVENRARRGRTFVYAADEWYLLAGWDVPPAREYDGFPQLENGVGLVRQLLDDWHATRADLPASQLGPATLACGTLIAPVLAGIVAELNALTGASVRLAPVVNQFFGPVTTVSGLLAGRDVVASLRDRPPGETVILPRAMFMAPSPAGLAAGTRAAAPSVTLDDMSLADISRQLGLRVEVAGTMSEALRAIS
jgi:putative radical SAM enzyme (TIGR03279 family)